MIVKKTLRYYRNHGFRKTLARSFLELSRRLDSSFQLSGDTSASESNATATSEAGEKVSPLGDNGEANIVNILAFLIEKVKEIENPQILELGSRAVTKESLRDMLELNFPHKYIGFDIHEGPNVDIVGDAHELGALFLKEQFDVVMSKAVFEHLAMPWKVVLEINKILKQGGLLFINTLQTFPLHEKPWDFWRFSDEAWKVLLNKWTGFEIIHANMEFPCTVVPKMDVMSIKDWEMNHEAYLLSNVIARKVRHFDENRLKWNIDIKDFLDSNYPKRP